jgi:hypothetical protein
MKLGIALLPDCRDTGDGYLRKHVSKYFVRKPANRSAFCAAPKQRGLLAHSRVEQFGCYVSIANAKIRLAPLDGAANRGDCFCGAVRSVSRYHYL